MPVQQMAHFKVPENNSRNQNGALEMDQQVKALAAKPDDRSSIPGTHMTEGKNGLLQVVLISRHRLCYMCAAHTHSCTLITKWKFKNNF